jgi:3-oxoacyl-[acyl-carrier-protein] synthase II
MKQRRVVVTGMGTLSPIGNNLNDFWSNLVNGIGGAGPITKFDSEKFKTHFACEVKNYNPEDFFDKKEARKYDAFCQYALVVADEAVKDANIDFSTLNTNRIGCIWGSGNGGFQTFEDQITEYVQSGFVPRFSPFFIPKVILDTAPGLISIKYGLRGVNFSTVSACASANSAMVDALFYIKWGKADMIITGGSEAAITPGAVGGFGALKALSTNNENYQTASKPFDVDREGFVIGEGAGALIFEELEHALKRGATIYAEVAGGGMSGDAYHMTASHPEGLGAKLGMEAALEDAQLNASDVDYINAHATSTGIGDLSELKAIQALFGDDISKINISATKSMTGHLLGAAGAVEGIAAIKALQEGIIPPTINTQSLDPAIDSGFNLTLGKAVKRDIKVAMSNNFGFGGHNVSIIFKKYSA